MSKYHLTSLIQALSKEELRNFKLYTSRLQTSKAGINKNVRLFEEIREKNQDEFSESLLKCLFPDENRNAYYRLKNRLTDDIENSLLLLHREMDDRTDIYKFIKLANIFRLKSKYDLSFYYLKKAEYKAQESYNLDLLNLIFDEIIRLSVDHYLINPEEYFQKKKENQEKHQKTMAIDYLISVINYKMVNANFDARDKDVSYELERLIQTLSIDLQSTSTIDLEFKVHELVRKNLLQKKDFPGLENYLIECFERFSAQSLFVGKYYEKTFVILNWLINVCTINKKFSTSMYYAEILQEHLHKDKKKFFSKYSWMFHQALVINNSFLGRNDIAQQLLLEIKENPEFSGSTFYDHYVNLNLAISYYNDQKYKLALKALLPLLDYEVQKTLIPSLQLSIHIVELILHYENGDQLYLLSKIPEIKRHFNKELKLGAYNKEKEFIRLIEMMAQRPDWLRHPKVKDKVEKWMMSLPPFEPGSNEAISYKLWLQAKMSGINYYQLVLKAVGGF